MKQVISGLFNLFLLVCTGTGLAMWLLIAASYIPNSGVCASIKNPTFQLGRQCR